jgi:DNA-binding MarR family transcriptional regulator
MDTWAASEPDTVPRTLGRLRVALEDSYVRASRDLGLTAQQAELLCAAMRPSAVGDLARVLRCDRSNVSRLVDRASSRGLLERRAGELDARVSMVLLTEEGDALARRFIATLEGQLDDLLGQWSPQRQRSAVKQMNEIADALDAPRAAHTQGWTQPAGVEG